MRLGSINPCARGALVHNRVRFGSRRPLARRYALWAEATEAIQKFGTMVKSPSGFPIQSPYVSIANRQAGDHDAYRIRIWIYASQQEPDLDTKRTGAHLVRYSM